MSRPSVTVVMPFAGDASAARAAVHALLALDTRPGDELILVDNAGTAPPTADGVAVVLATGERSPAHARNVGAERASNAWILFLDADCRAPGDLLNSYFSEPVAGDVGALAGDVHAAPDGRTFVARYGAAKSFLSQEAHLEHPYRPRAVAANLLVRRAAFEQVGGFYEGVRAAEDTDFSWRLQESGWRLELRAGARVQHTYRSTLSELRRQWRSYAAGRAWLARRYQGFVPEPAVRRGLRRGRRRLRRSAGGMGRPAPTHARAAGRLERGGYLALDALLSAEELAGFTLSNRPGSPRHSPSRVVLITDRFPAKGDPLVEFARTLDGARVEAAARPEALDVDVARALEVDYREDDGAIARGAALAVLTARHPLRVMRDVARRARKGPGLSALAPAIRRLERDTNARVHALGADHTRATAERIARLAGRRLEHDRPRRARSAEK